MVPKVNRPMKSVIKKTFYLSFVCFLTVRSSDAALNLSIFEDSGDVVLQASGGVDTTALTFSRATNSVSYIRATGAFVQSANGSHSVWSGISGPTSINGTADSAGSYDSGDIFGVRGNEGTIYLPNDYSSGANISGESRWVGETLTSLGLEAGSYTWTWGSGETADSLTLNVVVPEVSSYPAIFGLAALVAVGLRRRRGLGRSLEP